MVSEAMAKAYSFKLGRSLPVMPNPEEFGNAGATFHDTAKILADFDRIATKKPRNLLI
jgi:hypothetical protein